MRAEAAAEPRVSSFSQLARPLLGGPVSKESQAAAAELAERRAAREAKEAKEASAPKVSGAPPSAARLPAAGLPAARQPVLGGERATGGLPPALPRLPLPLPPPQFSERLQRLEAARSLQEAAAEPSMLQQLSAKIEASRAELEAERERRHQLLLQREQMIKEAEVRRGLEVARGAGGCCCA